MVNISQPNKEIPSLQIGDGKLKKAFGINSKFKSLKDWFIGIIIRW